MKGKRLQCTKNKTLKNRNKKIKESSIEPCLTDHVDDIKKNQIEDNILILDSNIIQTGEINNSISTTHHINSSKEPYILVEEEWLRESESLDIKLIEESSFKNSERTFIDNVEGYSPNDRSSNISSTVIDRCDVWKEISTCKFMLEWKASQKYELMLKSTYDKLFEIKCLWSVGDRPCNDNDNNITEEQLKNQNDLTNEQNLINIQETSPICDDKTDKPNSKAINEVLELNPDIVQTFSQDDHFNNTTTEDPIIIDEATRWSVLGRYVIIIFYLILFKFEKCS